MNLLSGLDLFDLGRFLLVFGFTLAIIRSINNLTEFKSPRAENRKKLTNLGIAGVIVGIAVGLLSMGTMIPNEIKAIKGIGTDIIAIGFSCIFNPFFILKNIKGN